MKVQKKLQGPFRLSDPDFRNAELAMRRAVERARESAAFRPRDCDLRKWENC